ncbi:type II secretion system GspH family protein [Stieleria sp. JC731]|uniref:PulJ/GspJ family protein n=1 Tax=Pirellulaceae TaxID=2691357 RepID=UPI001E30D857|nr:prepilin-type N-terminal cleavage/methylation domain-containing protein [Stieleria sp. JC731]MCC9599470.1 type II secretion system GspH family protein [Stieleria sp. JC731]
MTFFFPADRRCHCRQSALTLIELVVALTLASIMMVTLLRMTGIITRETTQIQRQHIDRSAALRLSDRIRVDFENARAFRVDTGLIELGGYIAPGHLPGRVRYQVIGMLNTNALVRQFNGRQEICWLGVGGINVDLLSEVEQHSGTDSSYPDLVPIPDRIRITLTDDRNRLLIREVIHHHAQ